MTGLGSSPIQATKRNGPSEHPLAVLLGLVHLIIFSSSSSLEQSFVLPLPSLLA